LFKFDNWGIGDGEFFEPTYSDVEDNMYIYVIDWERRDIVVFDRGGEYIY